MAAILDTSFGPGDPTLFRYASSRQRLLARQVPVCWTAIRLRRHSEAPSPMRPAPGGRPTTADGVTVDHDFVCGLSCWRVSTPATGDARRPSGLPGALRVAHMKTPPPAELVCGRISGSRGGGYSRHQA